MTKKNVKIKIKLSPELSILILLLIVCSYFIFNWLNPSLKSSLNKLDFEVDNVQLELTYKNKNDVYVSTYVISTEDDYIYCSKLDNDNLVEYTLFKSTDVFYLEYKTVDNSTIVKLNDNDGEQYFDNLLSDAIGLKDYLNINYDNVSNYKYSKDLITFSDYRNNIFFDTTIKVSNKKIYELTQVYTNSNIIHTNTLKIDYDYSINIPKM